MPAPPATPVERSGGLPALRAVEDAPAPTSASPYAAARRPRGVTAALAAAAATAAPTAAPTARAADAPAALAALSGGSLATTASGSSEVSFLAREESPSGWGSSPPPQPQVATSFGDSPELQPGEIAVGGQDPVHIDELFDRLLTRLRRDLLDERERQGRLIGEGRW